MKNLKLKRLLRLCSILTSVTLLTTFATPTYAEDSVKDLENTTSDLQNKLSDLNGELADLGTELNSILSKMDAATDEIEQIKIELANAKGKEQVQYESMKKRIKYIYESGNTSFMEMLFSSKSMAELLNKADFIATVNEYDRHLLAELVKTKNTIEEKEQQLKKEQHSLSSLKAELDKKEAALTNKISSTSDELSQYSTLLKKAKEKEKAAQEALDKEVIPTPPPQKTEKPDVEEKPDTNTKPPENNKPSEDNKPSAPTPPIDTASSDVELLAALIECEAGSTNYEGMLAVGSVVINRMNHRYYPNSIRGVIYQSGQFSPVSSGKLEKVLERSAKPSCFEAARDAISGKNNVGDCLNFRAANTGHTGMLIGGNVFF